MNLVRVASPKPILDLADVKKHLNVYFDDDDGLIDSLIEAATDHIDGETWFGRALGPQTWDLSIGHCDLRIRGGLSIPLRPLIEVVSINYLDPSEVSHAWTDFHVTGAGARKAPGVIWSTLPGGWPSLASREDAMTIRFRCGYAKSDGASPAGEVEDVPYTIKAALKLMIGDLYANRERAAAEAYTTVDYLLNDYRVYG